VSAASDRIQELVYPTKPRLYVGLGDPPDTRVTAADLKAVIDERAVLLAALEMVRDADEDCKRDGLPRWCTDIARGRIDAAIAKARGQS